jgi:hypothetical protein
MNIGCSRNQMRFVSEGYTHHFIGGYRRANMKPKYPFAADSKYRERREENHYVS